MSTNEDSDEDDAFKPRTQGKPRRSAPTVQKPSRKSSRGKSSVCPDEISNTKSTPSVSHAEPGKLKPKSKGSLEGVAKMGSDLDKTTQFCPICQVPLNVLKISPIMHTSSCNITVKTQACPKGRLCLSTNIFHYRDLNHDELAAYRASEDFVAPDFVFSPQKAKLKKTPLKGSGGKKRMPTSPHHSTSKKKKNEPCCSKDLTPPQPSTSTTTVQLNSDDNIKKKLAFTDDVNSKEGVCEENSSPSSQDLFGDITANSMQAHDQNSLPDHLNESEMWCSDLMLGGSIPDGALTEPRSTAADIDPLLIVKTEHESEEFVEESAPLPSQGTSSANVVIQYHGMTPHGGTQEFVGNSTECPESCVSRSEAEDALQANCSVIFKAVGVNRAEAMTRSPLSVTLMVNQTGWEGIDIRGTESTNIQKLEVSLCKCAHAINVQCSVHNQDINSDVKLNLLNFEQHEKFFATMQELGLKNNDLHVQPVQNDTAYKKKVLSSTCNAISISSVGANTSVPSVVELLPVSLPVESENEASETREVTNAFAALKKASAVNENKRSVTPTMSHKSTVRKHRPSTPAPMIVTESTPSSWTIVPSSKKPPLFSGGPESKAHKNKKIPGYKRIPGTQFVVDAFNFGIIPGVKAYFLSHFHSDHYIGLRKDFNMPLFCSQVTANLVHLKIKVDKQHLYILKIGEPRVVHGVEVETFEANHCPGAVMFLFRLLDGQTFLHVGDFRAHPSMESYPQLRYVDKLYLDTTYCDPSYDFPSQEDVVNKVVQTVGNHLAKNEFTLIVCGTYTIGKEKVFMGIAEAFNFKIWAAADKRKTLNCLEEKALLDRLTSDAMLAQVHVANMRDIALDELQQYLKKFSSKYTHVVGIKPTGWTTSTSIKSKPSDFQKSTRGKVTIYGVPYSEHSSFSELRRFVRHIRPKDIQVTVNIGKSSKYRGLFNQWLSSNRNDNGQSKMIQFFTSSS